MIQRFSTLEDLENITWPVIVNDDSGGYVQGQHKIDVVIPYYSEG